MPHASTQEWVDRARRAGNAPEPGAVCETRVALIAGGLQLQDAARHLYPENRPWTPR